MSQQNIKLGNSFLVQLLWKLILELLQFFFDRLLATAQLTLHEGIPETGSIDVHLILTINVLLYLCNYVK